MGAVRTLCTSGYLAACQLYGPGDDVLYEGAYVLTDPLIYLPWIMIILLVFYGLCSCLKIFIHRLIPCSICLTFINLFKSFKKTQAM